MAILNSKQRLIIVGALQNTSNTTLGKLLSVSPSRISQLKNPALRKLNRELGCIKDSVLADELKEFSKVNNITKISELYYLLEKLPDSEERNFLVKEFNKNL